MNFVPFRQNTAGQIMINGTNDINKMNGVNGVNGVNGIPSIPKATPKRVRRIRRKPIGPPSAVPKKIKMLQSFAPKGLGALPQPNFAKSNKNIPDVSLMLNLPPSLRPVKLLPKSILINTPVKSKPPKYYKYFEEISSSLPNRLSEISQSFNEMANKIKLLIDIYNDTNDKILLKKLSKLLTDIENKKIRVPIYVSQNNDENYLDMINLFSHLDEEIIQDDKDDNIDYHDIKIELDELIEKSTNQKIFRRRNNYIINSYIHDIFYKVNLDFKRISEKIELLIDLYNELITNCYFGLDDSFKILSRDINRFLINLYNTNIFISPEQIIIGQVSKDDSSLISSIHYEYNLFGSFNEYYHDLYDIENNLDSILDELFIIRNICHNVLNVIEHSQNKFLSKYYEPNGQAYNKAKATFEHNRNLLSKK